MSLKRVLVVDDTREIGRMIQAALETLGPGLTTTVLPTAEEALQEIDRQAFDLMVIDVRLPGISGLELTRKLRSRRHSAKVIQISGINDPRLREMSTQLGADMFFAKPLVMNEFLAAVEKLIGSPKTTPRLGGSQSARSRPRTRVDQALAGLKQRLAASAAIVFDNDGKIFSAAGDLPAAAVRADFFPILSASLSAAGKAGRLFTQPVPENVVIIRGGEHDLAAAPLDHGYLILVVVQRSPSSVRLAVAMDELLAAQQDISGLLPRIAAAEARPAEKARGKPEAADQQEPAGTEVERELAELFSKHNIPVAKPEDVDAFWSNAADDKGSGAGANQDAISFEQAQKMGLTPKEGS